MVAFEPDKYPSRVVVTVTSADFPGRRPATVTEPVSEIVTVPSLASAAQVTFLSKFVILKTNPDSVKTGADNLGINAGPGKAIPLVTELLLVYPVLLAVTETLALCPGCKPLSVTLPEVVLTPTIPKVEIALQIKLGSKLVIEKLNPLTAEAIGPRIGGEPIAVFAFPVVDPTPSENPVRIALMVTVASAPGRKPATVIKPVALRLALPAVEL